MRTRLSVVLLAAAGVVGVAVPAGALPADELADRQWGLEQVGAESAWRVGRGAGVVVAVVDTGVDLDHPDLAGQVLPGRDFVDDDDVAQDEEGHGTHVAGVVAAMTGNGIGIAGVAPDARILPVRVLDEDGSGSGADVAAGIRWAAAQGADVINLSLGEDTQAVFGPSFADAVEEAWALGAICVVAAGNDFVLSSGFADQHAVVVSATDRRDGAPLYSNGVGSAMWGVAAPGGAAFAAAEDDVLSTYLDDTYGYLAGTSMAAPHVSGALAVLLSTGRSPQQAVDRLLATAVDLGPKGRDATFGSGRIALAAAVGEPPATTASVGGPAAPPPPPAAGPSGGAPDAGPATPARGTPAQGSGTTPAATPPTDARPVPGLVAPPPSPSGASAAATAALALTDGAAESGSSGGSTEGAVEGALEGVDVSKPLEDAPGAGGGGSDDEDDDRTIPVVIAAVLLVVALGGTGAAFRSARARTRTA